MSLREGLRRGFDHQFPIPMRGNELLKPPGRGHHAEEFPIPMRGNETPRSAAIFNRSCGSRSP